MLQTAIDSNLQYMYSLYNMLILQIVRIVEGINWKRSNFFAVDLCAPSPPKKAQPPLPYLNLSFSFLSVAG